MMPYRVIYEVHVHARVEFNVDVISSFMHSLNVIIF